METESKPPAALLFPYEGPPELRNAIGAALKRVVDPEMALSIVDVGLVYGVKVGTDTVLVTLTMTSSACPVTEVIMGDVEDELDRAVPDHYALDVQLTWEPAWTPECMSPRARDFMGW